MLANAVTHLAENLLQKRHPQIDSGSIKHSCKVITQHTHLLGSPAIIDYPNIMNRQSQGLDQPERQHLKIIWWFLIISCIQFNLHIDERKVLFV